MPVNRKIKASMTLEEVRRVLEAEVLNGRDLKSIEVRMGCGADLMSDVLAFTKPGSLLLTGLANAQAIRTAFIAGVSAICFVRGKRPSEEVLSLAQENDLPLLASTLPMFEACGRLYIEGLRGCSECED